MRLDKVCRACLCEDENMINMPDKKLLEKFLVFTDLPVQKEILNVSLNLCRSCEEKLIISCDFKEKCLKSHQILLCYVNDTEALQIGCSKQDDTEEDPVTNDNKKSSKLQRFPPRVVSQAIEESNRYFYKNTECIRCGFVGSNSRALSMHISIVHKDLKGRWCGACNEECDDLTNHREVRHCDKVICKFCNKKFRDKGHLNEHLRSHSVLRPFRCSFCEKSFVLRGQLNVHLKKHKGDQPYKCHVCVKSFDLRPQLQKHLKDDHLLDQSLCETCGKHVHSGSDQDCNILCSTCGKQFKTASKLRVHMRVHTGEMPYKCTFCDKRAKTRHQLVLHERTHTGEKPHVCHVCGKNFAQSSVLNTHMKLHTGRNVTCKICNQGFCRLSELRLHLRRHTGEKPYLCSECGKSFVQRSHLVEHNRTHSDLRPYQCNYCDKAFKKSSSLKQHVRIHLGETPYKCNQCSYACRQSYSLTQHMKQHVVDRPRADRPHVCSMCTKSFSTSALLISHSRIIHNISIS